MKAARIVAVAIAVALAAALPALGLPSFYVSLLTQTWIYAIVAMSLDLLVGFTGLVNFSQAALFGVGSYAVALEITKLNHDEFFSSMALGIAASVLTAAAFGLVALRSEGTGFIITTIALNEIVWGLAYQWVSVSGGDNGIIGVSRPHLGPFDLASGRAFYEICLACTLVTLVLLLAVVRSPFGLVLRGVKETPRRMRALGYDVWRYRYLAFLIAGAFAGAAGVLFAWYNQFVGPTNLALDTSTQFLIIVILGGIGTLFGQILSSAVVVFLSNGLNAITQRWELILGAVYVVIVMYAPDGLVGVGRRVWARLFASRAAAPPPNPLREPSA